MSGVLIAALLIACGGKDKDVTPTDWSCDGAEDVEVCTGEGTSDETDGFLHATVPVDDERSFLVTGVAESGAALAVDSLYDPDDDRTLYWFDWASEGNSELSLTNAFYVATDTVINWPIRPEDGELDRGTYDVVMASYTDDADLDPLTGVHVALTLHKNHGAGFAGGTVHALIVYADGLEKDGEVTAGTEAAIEVWRRVWAAFGITLDEEIAQSSIDPALPWPGEGLGEMEEAASFGDGKQVIVVVGETIDSGTKYLGVSGNIPGTLVSTGRTGTVISWLANAGIDAHFDDGDIETYGETLAHEVGHYVGLYHPVEDGFEIWDALDDTENCTAENQCQNDLATNLMFPWPVCGPTGCVTQDELTTQQQGVMHRYTGVY